MAWGMRLRPCLFMPAVGNHNPVLLTLNMARNIGWSTADVNGDSSRLHFGPDQTAITAHAVENDDDEQARKPLSVASVIEAPASILKHGGRYIRKIDLEKLMVCDTTWMVTSLSRQTRFQGCERALYFEMVSLLL